MTFLRHILLIRSKHPFDWLGHFLLCFCIALYRWDYAAIVALTIEGAQIESRVWQKWDHLIDLIFDLAGIVLATLLIKYLGSL